MDFTYGNTAAIRERGNLPELPIVNMTAEPYVTEAGAVLQSRPGLKASTLSMGASSVRGLFQMEGALSGQVFGVAGDRLYANSTNLGTIDGTGPVSFGSYEDYVFANAGASIWGYNGSSLAALTFPDSADVLRIVVGASRLIAIRKNSGRIYWSDALSTTINALSFATAENSPDRLKDLLFVGDTLILFGTETVEFWSLGQTLDEPFVPIVGRVYPVGIRDTGCAVPLASTFAWITNHNQVCITSPSGVVSPTGAVSGGVVSTPGLQSLIEESSSAALWTFWLDGEEYLAVRLDDSTWTMNARTRLWSEMTSYDKTNWLPRCYRDGYFGSSDDGTLLQWSDDYSDLGGTLERRFRAWSAVIDTPVNCYKISLRDNSGQTPFTLPPYSSPTVELRLSRDGGYSWSNWRQRSLGAMGNYREPAIWLSNGVYGYPGILAEVRVTDPVPFRISQMTMNGGYGDV